MFSNKIAVERGVGGDEAVEPAIEKHLGERADVVVVEIGRHLENQRHLPAMLRGEFRLLGFQGF